MIVSKPLELAMLAIMVIGQMAGLPDVTPQLGTPEPAFTSPLDSDGDGMYTPGEMEDAINYRFHEYEWPPNFSITSDNITSNLNLPIGSVIEAPGEYTVLGGYHTCAWEVTLLIAIQTGDQKLIDESMFQLVDIGQSKNPLSRDEEGKRFYRDLYAKAVNGEPGGLQNSVSSNCDFIWPYFDNSTLCLRIHICDAFKSNTVTNKSQWPTMLIRQGNQIPAEHCM